MTISSTTNRVSYAGDGGTTAFSFPHRFLADADLLVILVTDSTGAEVTQTLTTDYTVSGAGNASGGTVTMNSAPASGETLVIINDPALKQQSDYVDAAALDAETLEDNVDRLTLIAQRTRVLVERSFRLSDGDTSGASLELPAPTALRLVRWNSAGTALENTDLSDVGAAALADYEVPLKKPGAAIAGESYGTLGKPASLSALQALDVSAFTAGETVYMRGRTAVGDGGEGHFRWDSSKLSTEVGNDEVTATKGDGGIYIAPASDKTGASGAWVRQFSDGYIWLEWYGAVGDGATDDATAINAAISAANASAQDYDIFWSRKDFAVGSAIQIPDRVGVVGNGDVKLRAISGTFPVNTGVLTLGGDGSSPTFRQGVRNIQIVCSDISGSEGLVLQGCQELSHVERVEILDPGKYGIHIKAGSGASTQNIGFTDLWVIMSKTASTAGSRALYIAAAGVGPITIRRATWTYSGSGTFATKPDHTVEVAAGSAVRLHGESWHLENGGGIQVASMLVADGQVSLDTINGLGDPPDLIRIGSGCDSFEAKGVYPDPSATGNTINDLKNSVTLNGPVGFYSISPVQYEGTSVFGGAATFNNALVNKLVTSSSGSTINVANANVVRLNYSSATDVNTFSNPTDGQVIYVINGGSGAVTLKHGTGNLSLDGGTDLTLGSADQGVTLAYDGSGNFWRQCG